MAENYSNLLKQLRKIKDVQGSLPEARLNTLIAQNLETHEQRAERMKFLFEEIRDNLPLGSLPRKLLDALSDDFDKLRDMPYQSAQRIAAPDQSITRGRKKPSKLVELCYSSKAVEPFSSEALRQLIDSAAIYNEQHNITGILYYDDQAHNFMQILEGGEKPVRTLMHKISNDKRHREIILRSKYKTDSRAFSDYPMMLKTASEIRSTISRPQDFDGWVSKNLKISNEANISKSAKWMFTEMQSASSATN